ncbi:MAG: hypothetical protein K0V04_02950, partial [Deltaproteobacteria bacterium]|nr:hypothetical protein [Deltaproteobacteria bacterium]
YVIEGNLFWGDNWSAVEAETLAETLAIADNSVVGFIDYLVDTAGTTDPEGVAWTILEEVSPMCTAVDTSMWGEGLINWYDNFLARVVEYLDSFIGFDPNDLDPDDDEAGGDIEEPLA